MFVTLGTHLNLVFIIGIVAQKIHQPEHVHYNVVHKFLKYFKCMFINFYVYLVTMPLIL